MSLRFVDAGRLREFDGSKALLLGTPRPSGVIISAPGGTPIVCCDPREVGDAFAAVAISLSFVIVVGEAIELWPETFIIR